jgi:multisubunit Na+/H+ antiporter MnhB subunit
MLAAPGALLLVTTYHLLGLDNPNFNSFFHGVSIGSITLFFILIFRTIKGLKQTATRVPIRKLKYAARVVVGIGVATLAILQLPISFVLGCGALSGLAIEFIL